MSADKIDAAIDAAAEPEPGQVRMFQARVDLASGRPAMVAVPADITDYELLSLINGVVKIGDTLRAQRPAPSPIVPIRALPSVLRQ